MLILAACGGTSETPSEAAPDDGAAVVEPTAESAATEAPAPTVEPPTAQPATAVHDPTAAPTVEPTVAPPEESQPLALPSGLCANPYFPVVEGRTYTYETDVPDFGATTYTFSFTNVTPTSFDMVLGDTAEDLITYTWQCTEEGLLSPNIQFLGGGPSVTIETVEASGITFPVPDNVAVGSTWTTRYVLNTTMADTGFGAMQMATTMEQVNEIIAVEAVTVPYGTFDTAIKVQTTGTMEITTTAADMVLPPTTVDLATTTWYVENVGRVRSEEVNDLMGDGVLSTTVTELIAIDE